MTAEGNEMLAFATTGGTTHAFRPCTLVLGADTAISQCKHPLGAHANLSDAMIGAFVEASATEHPIDARQIHLGHPARPAKATEMDEWARLTSAASPELSGLLSVTGVGFSSDHSQALVLVRSWRIDGANPFEYLVVVQREAGGWGIHDIWQVSGMPKQSSLCTVPP